MHSHPLLTRFAALLIAIFARAAIVKADTIRYLKNPPAKDDNDDSTLTRLFE